MKEDPAIPELSLFGGPLQRLGARLGLARGRTGTFALGLALGLTPWAVLAILALLRGRGPDFFSLADVGVHVRLLLVIPLLTACESFAAPRMAEFVRNIRSSGVVPEAEEPALASNVRRVTRLADSWLSELLLLLLALSGPLLESLFPVPSSSGNWAAVLALAEGKLNLLNGWYLIVCLPLFRFLLFRWLWRLGLWWYFLRGLGRLKLRLVPTHPDGAAGLGYLEVVQEHLAPLALGFSAVLAGSFAEGLYLEKMAFESLYIIIAAFLVIAVALFLGPLFLFARKLWDCRSTGMDEYMAMAARYVRAFDRRWLRDEQASGESQLGTADIQSLADLANSVDIVRNMRVIPAGRRLFLLLAAAVILPMLPLLLLEFPVGEIAARIFRGLVGL